MVAELRFDQRDDVVVGRLAGEIDGGYTRDLQDALSRRLTNRSRGLVLDLSDVRYLDSVGIEFLFDLARRMRTHRQGLRLVVPADSPMRRVLDLFSIDQLIGLDATPEAAIEVIREGRGR
jgi:anti-anti-sigma factor